jgi:hypothetical protein
MTPAEYEANRSQIAAIGDPGLAAVLRLLDSVFRSRRFRPREDLDAPAVLRDVTAWLPTPFVGKIDAWLAESEAGLLHLLAQTTDIAPNAAQRVRIASRFRGAFLGIDACWLMLIGFLPLLFLALLQRIDDDTLQRHAGDEKVARELAKVLFYFNRFYSRLPEDSAGGQARQKEADQRSLLARILRLFRELSRRGALGSAFLLTRMSGPGAARFEDLFPERLESLMLLHQQLRNKVVHHQLEDRLAWSPRATAAMYAIVRDCFIDVLAMLLPASRHLGLCYVADLSVRADEVEARVLDFSGEDGPHNRRYLMRADAQPEFYALVQYHLFLMNRDKQVEAGGTALLEPADYVDLTPFLVADEIRRSLARRDLAPEQRERLLFVLRQYLEPKQLLRFTALGAGADLDRPDGPADRDAAEWIALIDRMRSRTRQLIVQLRLSEEGEELDSGEMRQQLWAISSQYLASLLDVHRYDDRAEAEAPEDAGPRAVYEQELYVEPAESAEIDRFMASDRRALLLVGDSGLGKSNLLVHRTLHHVRSHRLVAFLSARRFEQPHLREMLIARLVSRIRHTWQSLERLDRWLDDKGEMLLLVIDAVNEYSGPLGPLGLLGDLIATMQAEPMLRRCKVIASCRTETWTRYALFSGSERPLDPAVFFGDGAPVRLGTFDDPSQRRALFDRYRARYGLRPASFDLLSRQVQELLSRPFMMRLLAEAYGNPPGTAAPRHIPRRLDYFSLFELLTERKRHDAAALLPMDHTLARDAIGRRMDELTFLLARMLYRRLSHPADGAGEQGGDTLPVDAVDKDPELQPYVRPLEPLTTLDALLQVGLLVRRRIAQRDPEGRLRDSNAYGFFSDQYSQYCLASAYQREVIGWADQAAMNAPARLQELSGTMQRIISESVRSPLLAGALDHWFEKNMRNFHGDQLAPMAPLLEKLAEGSAASRHYAMALPVHLVLSGYLAPLKAFEVLCRGSDALRREAVNAFAVFWPELPPWALRAYLDVCDAESKLRVADLFSQHLTLEPERVVAYLRRAISTIELRGAADALRIGRQSPFVLEFVVFSTISCFDRPEVIAAVRRFFRATYGPVVELAAGRSRGVRAALLHSLRPVVNLLFDWWGRSSWQQFIADFPESGNDRFFTELDGVCQQAVLAEFLPYAIALHNGELDRLSLAAGSPFRALALRMLGFRTMSVIGFNALICLPPALIRLEWTAVEAFLLELFAQRSAAAGFYGNLLVANLAYVDASLAVPGLVLMRDRIAPLLLREGLKTDWSIAFCIASLDVPQTWPVLRDILEQLFAFAENPGRSDACAELAATLYKACYCADIALGRNLIAFLLEQPERFLGPVWRGATLRAVLAMATRSPATLESILGDGRMELAREARAHDPTGEIVKQSRLFPLQVALNRWLARMWASEPRLRAVAITHVVGGLALGKSADDFAVAIRHVLVQFIAVYFGDDAGSARHERLSLEGIAAHLRRARPRRRPAGASSP